MKIEEIRIKNYKSLEDVTFTPDNFSVLIGPNASGKSNFAGALGFLSKVYRDGLEQAVKADGGFQNMVFRDKENKDRTIEFSVSLLLGYDFFLVETLSTDHIQLKTFEPSKNIKLVHCFSLKQVDEVFFHVDKESLELSKQNNDDSWEVFASVKRTDAPIISIAKQDLYTFWNYQLNLTTRLLTSNTLLVSNSMVLKPFFKTLGNFYFSVLQTRVPSSTN